MPSEEERLKNILKSMEGKVYESEKNVLELTEEKYEIIVAQYDMEKEL